MRDGYWEMFCKCAETFQKHRESFSYFKYNTSILKVESVVSAERKDLLIKVSHSFAKRGQGGFAAVGLRSREDNNENRLLFVK